jgi:hypothetical protein
MASGDSNVDTGGEFIPRALGASGLGVPGQNTENAVLGTGTLQAFKAEL